MKIYLAGPMTGHPDFNYPSFHEAAKRLRDAGHEVFNPAENHDGRTDLPLQEYFKADLPQVCDADVIAVLPNWQYSKGATLEVSLARHLDKPVLDAVTLDLWQESATQEAERLVHGPRNAAYGHPSQDFARTGRLWGAILGSDDIAPETVGLMMAALKISREVNKPGRDNRVDAAGYMECVDWIHRRREAMDEIETALIEREAA